MNSYLTRFRGYMATYLPTIGGEYYLKVLNPKTGFRYDSSIENKTFKTKEDMIDWIKNLPSKSI